MGQGAEQVLPLLLDLVEARHIGEGGDDAEHLARPIADRRCAQEQSARRHSRLLRVDLDHQRLQGLATQSAHDTVLSGRPIQGARFQRGERKAFAEEPLMAMPVVIESTTAFISTDRSRFFFTPPPFVASRF